MFAILSLPIYATLSSYGHFTVEDWTTGRSHTKQWWSLPLIRIRAQHTKRDLWNTPQKNPLPVCYLPALPFTSNPTCGHQDRKKVISKAYTQMGELKKKKKKICSMHKHYTRSKWTNPCSVYEKTFILRSHLGVSAKSLSTNIQQDKSHSLQWSLLTSERSVT